MGKYNRERYKQIILHVNTKESLDKIKSKKELSSYNDTILVLIKHWTNHPYE